MGCRPLPVGGRPVSADDYTPTTAEVEADWLNWQSMLAEDSDVEANSRAVMQWRRWLVAHDAEVARAAAAEAWDRAADRWYEFCQAEAATSDPDKLPTEPVNPYRKVATDE